MLTEFKMTFSGIIRRSDKPELNTKIDMLNAELKSLSLNKGHDFNNIKFGHLKQGWTTCEPKWPKKISNEFY